jgi:hypothetical protein
MHDDKVAEQCGTEKVCKTFATGSIPAVTSTSDWQYFIQVITRGNRDEMHELLAKIYQEKFAPNIDAHNMLRLANVIICNYAELQGKYIELSKENARLNRRKGN